MWFNASEIDLFLSKSMLSVKDSNFLSLYLCNGCNEDVKMLKCKSSICIEKVRDSLFIYHSFKDSFMFPSCLVKYYILLLLLLYNILIV